MFLPYYIIRYQNEYSEIEENNERLDKFLREFEDINQRLGKSTIKDKSTIYSDLNGLIMRIADYMLINKEKMKKGVEKVMGGQILELESERLTREGRKEGRSEGKVFVYYKELGYSIEKISTLLNISCEDVENIINSLNEEENNNSF